MVWGDKKLKTLVEIGKINYTYDSAINPASINVRLGNSWLTPSPNQEIKLGDEVDYIQRYSDHTFIYPGDFLLATTLEWIDVPIVAAVFVQGRSSIGRAGLSVQNAGFVDPGFRGHITLELKNDAPYPILLQTGYPVAQLVYMDAADVQNGYRGKYYDQSDATGSRMNLDELDKIFKRR